MILVRYRYVNYRIYFTYLQNFLYGFLFRYWSHRDSYNSFKLVINYWKVLFCGPGQPKWPLKIVCKSVFIMIKRCYRRYFLFVFLMRIRYSGHNGIKVSVYLWIVLSFWCLVIEITCIWVFRSWFIIVQLRLLYFSMWTYFTLNKLYLFGTSCNFW